MTKTDTINTLSAFLGLTDGEAEVMYDGMTFRGSGYTAFELAAIAEKAIRNLSINRDAWVRQARKDGATWQEIAEAHGLTRQGAQQRYGSLV